MHARASAHRQSQPAIEPAAVAILGVTGCTMPSHRFGVALQARDRTLAGAQRALMKCYYGGIAAALPAYPIEAATSLSKSLRTADELDDRRGAPSSLTHMAHGIPVLTFQGTV